MMRRCTGFIAGLLLLLVAAGTARAQVIFPAEGIADPAVEATRQFDKLYSSDPQERAMAADRLAELGPKGGDATAALVSLLADDAEAQLSNRGMSYTVKVSRCAARALAGLGPQGVEKLLDALKEQRASVRAAAASGLDGLVLGRGNPRIVSALLPCMKDESADVRFEAVWVLYHARDARSVAALAAAIRDPDARVSGHAASLLGDIGPPAVEPLLAARGDRDPAVRVRVAGAMGENVMAAQRSKQAVDGRIVESLIAAIADPDATVREAAFHAIRHVDEPRATAAVVAALKSPDAATRMTAIACLDREGNAAAVEPLISLLDDEQFFVRERAAGVLGRIRDRRAAEPLLKTLKDPLAPVRSAAACALGLIEDPRAVEPLAAALKDDDRQVRVHAAIGLGEIKDQRAVGPLRAALSDRDPFVRRYVIYGLALLGDRQGRDGLIAQFNDADPEVRAMAAFSLAQMKEPRALEALREVAGNDSNSFARGHAQRAIEIILRERAGQNPNPAVP